MVVFKIVVLFKVDDIYCVFVFNVEISVFIGFKAVVNADDVI